MCLQRAADQLGHHIELPPTAFVYIIAGQLASPKAGGGHSLLFFIVTLGEHHSKFGTFI